MTRLDQLVMAVLQSSIVQPLHTKLLLKVFGDDKPPLKMTLEQYNRFSAAHDAEVIDRVVNIAWGIEQKLADRELRELDQMYPAEKNE